MIVEAIKLKQVLHLLSHIVNVWLALTLLCFVSFDLHLYVRGHHHLAFASLMVLRT